MSLVFMNVACRCFYLSAPLYKAHSMGKPWRQVFVKLLCIPNLMSSRMYFRVLELALRKAHLILVSYSYLFKSSSFIGLKE